MIPLDGLRKMVERIESDKLRIAELGSALRDAWPLMALKTRWLEKHPHHRATIESVLEERE